MYMVVVKGTVSLEPNLNWNFYLEIDIECQMQWMVCLSAICRYGSVNESTGSFCHHAMQHLL